MAVLRIVCPDCGHEYRSLVMEGTRVPAIWLCSSCGGRDAAPVGEAETGGHPWSDGCAGMCCG
jgi:hypothetical protein